MYNQQKSWKETVKAANFVHVDKMDFCWTVHVCIDPLNLFQFIIITHYDFTSEISFLTNKYKWKTTSEILGAISFINL